MRNQQYLFIGFLWLCCFSSAVGSAQSMIGMKTLDHVKRHYGSDAMNRIVAWGELVEADAENQAMSDSLKLANANDYFNQVKWVSDIEHWGQEDFWATPVETLATNGGDCEDYSIGKYYSLLRSRLEPEKLRITYVKSITYNQAHMVVTYYPTPGAEPLVLDNINGTILPASQRDDLLPIYSFDGSKIWVAQGPNSASGSSTTSLPQWKKVLERIEEQLQ